MRPCVFAREYKNNFTPALKILQGDLKMKYVLLIMFLLVFVLGSCCCGCLSVLISGWGSGYGPGFGIGFLYGFSMDNVWVTASLISSCVRCEDFFFPFLLSQEIFIHYNL